MMTYTITLEVVGEDFTEKNDKTAPWQYSKVRLYTHPELSMQNYAAPGMS